VTWKRWLWTAAVAAVIVLAIVLGYRKQPVLSEFAQVTSGPMRVTVEEEGKTRVVDRYVVSAPVAGVAQRVRLKVGDPVARDQVLFWLEPLRPEVLDARSRAEAQARVSAAEAALSAAEERVRAAAAADAYWESQFARIKNLVSTGDVSREALEKTSSEARAAQASLRSAEHAAGQARAEVEAARAALRYSAARPADGNPQERVAVRAPVAGRVLKVLRESEGVVAGGQAVLEIGNARGLEVEVEVLSADAVQLQPAMRVLFERWGGDKPLEGRIRRIEPVAFTKVSALGVEEQRVLVLVDITSPPEQWARLGDGYRVEAAFILWESPEVLQVPASALFRYRDNWAVFVVENGVARRRPVEVGRRNGQVAQILSGLSQGQQVIIHPDNSVDEGTAVKSR
jgi:HlyD family secretion protein